MNHPAPILRKLEKQSEIGGLRLALIGEHPFIKSLFRRLILPRATAVIEEQVEPTDVRESLLRIRDTMSTTPFQWEKPVLWIDGAEHVFSNMSFPEDFPNSTHAVVAALSSDQTYVPPSFQRVVISIKGAGAPLQDVIHWLLRTRSMEADIDVIRFLAGEYKDSLFELEKVADQIFLRIHPRTTVTAKDIEPELSIEWDCDLIIKALLEGDEGKVLKEFHHALKTFHPKGIVTILSRRVMMLMQISTAIVLNNGAPDPSGDIRPWVWRQNLELVKEIPPQRLFKWAVALDKAYASLSRNSLPHRWVLFQMMAAMARL